MHLQMAYIVNQPTKLCLMHPQKKEEHKALRSPLFLLLRRSQVRRFVYTSSNPLCGGRRPHLFGEQREGLGSGQVGEPVVNRALGPRGDQPEVVLLVDLWLALPRVRECVVAQLLRHDAAEVRTDLWSNGWA